MGHLTPMCVSPWKTTCMTKLSDINVCLPLEDDLYDQTQ